MTDRIRVAAVQYALRGVSSFEEFAKRTTFFVKAAADVDCDFVLFPELLTNELLSIEGAKDAATAVAGLEALTEPYLDHFGSLAREYGIHIIPGSHLTRDGDQVLNIATLFHRDGRIDEQVKVHITPSEVSAWGVASGDHVEVFQTDVGKVAVAICYDVEFPEYVRIAKAKGAEILFVPYNTDMESGHFRVRHCAAARAIENHMYVVLAGAIGNLAGVAGSDMHWAQSAILSPSDLGFARQAVVTEAPVNVETMIVADLDVGLLRQAESAGTVRTWQDRRTDLYEVRWKNEANF